MQTVQWHRGSRSAILYEHKEIFGKSAYIINSLPNLELLGLQEHFCSPKFWPNIVLLGLIIKFKSIKTARDIFELDQTCSFPGIGFQISENLNWVF